MSNEGLRARAEKWMRSDEGRQSFSDAYKATMHLSSPHPWIGKMLADFAQQIREEDCKAICVRCRSGETTYLHPDGNIRHTQAGSICDAAAVRNLAEKEPT